MTSDRHTYIPTIWIWGILSAFLQQNKQCTALYDIYVASVVKLTIVDYAEHQKDGECFIDRVMTIHLPVAYILFLILCSYELFKLPWHFSNDIPIMCRSFLEAQYN